jgi:hypothetical protein
MVDALITIINISLNIEAKVAGLNDGFEILDEFDSGLISLQKTCGKESLR